MVQRRQSLRHLFRDWDLVAERLQHARRIVLFLDFDGTLVPIQSNRELFRLQETQAVLTRIVANRRVSVIAISGRRRADLRRLLGIRGIQYLGLYGSENGRLPSIELAVKKTLIEARAIYQTAISKYPGIDIENKAASFCVHLGDSDVRVRTKVRRSMRGLLVPFRDSLHLFENLRDIEVAPKIMQGKGAAVHALLDLPIHRDALPIYFGDDFSDEPAFAELNTRRGADESEGIAILVGKPRRTSAHYILRNPAEVVAALTRIEETLT
jgi:trehalose-phosphatase